MANLRALLFLAVAAVMLAPAASAQSVLPAKATINGYAAAPTQATIPLGGTASFNFTLTSVKVTNMVCNGPVDGTVNLSLYDSGLPGVTGAVSPSLTVTFPAAGAGTTQDATGTLKTGSVASLAVSVAANAMPNHAHAFTVNATFNAVPTGCTISAVPDDKLQPAMASIVINIQTGMGSSNSTSNPTGGCTPSATTTCPTTPANTSKASPLADVPTVALMMLAVAFVVSRRRAL